MAESVTPDWTTTAATLPASEVDAVLDEILSLTERDYRGYQMVFVRRRLAWVMSRKGISSLGELRRRIAREPELLAVVLDELSIGVTQMFRDPEVFRTIREKVMPVLATSEFVRVWVAGCATGEEAYSMAILLDECGLGSRSFVYATDLHPPSVAQARAGVFDPVTMRANTRNYLEAGGEREFSSYFTSGHGSVIMSRKLRDRILFSRHDLVHDGSFNVFELVLCRNVMIYFDRDLRMRVHDALTDSLRRLGFLVLGNRESLRFSPRFEDYEEVDRECRIYRKIR